MPVDTEFINCAWVKNKKDAIEYLDDFPEICSVLVDDACETVDRHDKSIRASDNDPNLLFSVITRLSNIKHEAQDVSSEVRSESCDDEEAIAICKAMYSKLVNETMNITDTCQDIRLKLQDLVNATRESDPDIARKAESAKEDLYYNIVQPMSSI